jgi:hypothetical protein
MPKDKNTYYEDFGITPLDKKIMKNELIHKLLLKPLKEKRQEIPRFINHQKDNTHQLDLLFLPDDNGYKYLLVIVDVATSTIDCRPLKNKNSENVLKNTLDIYNSGVYLKQPKIIHVDDGTEFKGVFL